MFTAESYNTSADVGSFNLWNDRVIYKDGRVDTRKMDFVDLQMYLMGV